MPEDVNVLALFEILGFSKVAPPPKQDAPITKTKPIAFEPGLLTLKRFNECHCSGIFMVEKHTKIGRWAFLGQHNVAKNTDSYGQEEVTHNVKLTGRRRPKAGGHLQAQLAGGPC